MDKRAMIAEIAARHGVRLDPDDPAFLLVELNQMAFEGKEAELKTQADQAEKRLTELIGALQAAGDIYKGQIEAYTNAQGQTIKMQMEKDAHVARDAFNNDSRAAIAASLKTMQQAVVKTIEAEVSEPMDAIRWHQKTRLWSTLALCLCAGLVGGFLGVLASAYFIRDQHVTTNLPSPVVNQKR